jgi:hypothetical protein
VTDRDIVVSKKTFIPEIVDDSGKPLVGPDIDAVLKRVTELAQVAQLAKIRKTLERQNFKGQTDPWKLHANDQVQHLDTLNTHPDDPWISCFIINRGPKKVRIQINDSSQRWIKMGPGETRAIDYSHAAERISYINYQCEPGETAIIEVEGAY